MYPKNGFDEKEECKKCFDCEPVGALLRTQNQGEPYWTIATAYRWRIRHRLPIYILNIPKNNVWWLNAMYTVFFMLTDLIHHRKPHQETTKQQHTEKTFSNPLKASIWFERVRSNSMPITTWVALEDVGLSGNGSTMIKCWASWACRNCSKYVLFAGFYRILMSFLERFSFLGFKQMSLFCRLFVNFILGIDLSAQHPAWETKW